VHIHSTDPRGYDVDDLVVELAPKSRKSFVVMFSNRINVSVQQQNCRELLWKDQLVSIRHESISIQVSHLIGSFPHACEPRKLSTGAIALYSYSHFPPRDTSSQSYDFFKLDYRYIGWVLLSVHPGSMVEEGWMLTVETWH